MFELKVVSRFAAAHNLKNFHGKCENLHGHNWLVEVHVSADGLDEVGLVMDFGEIKRHLAEVLDDLDHKYLNELEYFKTVNVSSENIACYIYEKMADRISTESRGRARVSRVSAWESDTSCATFIP